MKKNIVISTNNVKHAIGHRLITVYVLNVEEYIIAMLIAREKIGQSTNKSVWKILFLDLHHKNDPLISFNI